MVFYKNKSNFQYYTWNERNQLISSVDSSYSTAYVYGQDGQRSNKYTQTSETLYFNKMWTLHTDSGNSVYGGQSAKNIYLGETRIVTKLNGGNSPTYQEEYYKQYFYHSDHLGSASLISDYNGDEYQRIEYTPYGETWVEKTSNTGMEYLPYKFTAKELDEETGLYYYGARYLDPKYSMWISTDPALGEYIPAAGKATVEEAGKIAGQGGIFNSVNGNLYHYAGNNPVKYVDPDGRISGYLNDSTGAGGFGHSAMFVELYDDDGNICGIAIYEVGSTDKDGNFGRDKFNKDIENDKKYNRETNVLSHAKVGGVASSSNSSGDTDQAGVFVRWYEGTNAEDILNMMREDPVNQRYDNVLIMDTGREQDCAIQDAAERRGKNFGRYKVIRNNCTEYATNCLQRRRLEY